jgi:hypothetical protein
MPVTFIEEGPQSFAPLAPGVISVDPMLLAMNGGIEKHL